MEDEFTAKALRAGLTEEEAKSAFNANMMSTGLLSEFPAGFAKEHGRRWLVSAFEAGDVVLHKPHVVCFVFRTVSGGALTNGWLRFMPRRSIMMKIMLFVLRLICGFVIHRSRMIRLVLFLLTFPPYSATDRCFAAMDKLLQI
jgi:hypothetical protein